MSVKVQRVESEQYLKKAHAIRKEVFVEEQKVPLRDEIDEHESESYHYVAFDEQGDAVGACRWRHTENGYKLERFAVLKSCRGKGVGYALLEKVIEEISLDGKASPKHLYLHAQLGAIPLYEKFDFKKVGEQFSECNIWHYHMERVL